MNVDYVKKFALLIKQSEIVKKKNAIIVIDVLLFVLRMLSNMGNNLSSNYLQFFF